MKVLLGTKEPPTKKITVQLVWEPKDLWIGIYWDRGISDKGENYLLMYVNIIPMFPIAIAWRLKK